MDNDDPLLAGFDAVEKMKLRMIRQMRGQDIIGYCYWCGDWALRRDCRQVERAGKAVWVCWRDGSVVDEHPPFA